MDSMNSGYNKKAADMAAFFGISRLEGRFNFESPGFQKRFWDVLRILVTARPFAQPCRAEILIWSELELLHRLFERGDNRDHRPNRLRLAPVRIAASSCHIK